MASVVCLHFNMQEEDILDLTNAKCHFVYAFSQLVANCVTWGYTLEHMPRYQQADLNTKCQAVTLMVKLLFFIVT